MLFGSKVVRKDAGAIDRVCPWCGVPGPHTLVEADNYFTVYFIPLFRTGRADDQVRCRSCRQLFPARMTSPSPAAWSCRTCANVNPGTSNQCLKCGASSA
ncbi:MAG TPA: zinc ribbon domain-containing protein [Candidatus Xenobia bacterium]|jgi:hypothetical protein